MILTDTHTHLYSEAFIEDRNKVIRRALDEKIQRFFIPAIDSQTTQAMYDLEKAYPSNIFLMMGLHPTSVKPENHTQELEHVKSELDRRKFYGVGEIGIDLYWDKSTLRIQQEAFHKQIEWAKQLDLPIVIHCREAFDEIFEVLEEHKGDDLYGIFHCFTGSLDQAKHILGYGNFKLGIGGVVTFKNSGLDKVVSQLQLKDLVLETDSPYLAPAPFRGKRNESAYVAKVADKVAELFQTSRAEVDKITGQNALQIFQLDE